MNEFEIRAFPCPVELCWHGRPVTLRPRERVLLLRFLCAKDLTVSRAALVTALWRDAPADGAGDTLRTHLSNVRRAVRRVAVDEAAEALFMTLRFGPGGASYRLAVDPGRIDVRVWEARLQAGRDRLLWEPSRAAEAELAAVLGWPGVPFLDAKDGVPFLDAKDGAFARAEGSRLGGLRREARLQLVDHRMQDRRHRDVVADLKELVRERPGDYGVWYRLIVSLWWSLQDEAAATACRAAIEAFRRLGLGLADLEKLQGSVLRGDLPR